jgi:hypothetical protein
MKNATDSSTIKWTGFVDGAALFKSFDKASLISCGLSLHSPYDTNGLIVPDGDAEKFLSPLMIDKCSIQCARGLSRELYRTTADRGAFAETFGISVDSSVFGVLFGDASEYSGPIMLEFERRLAFLIGKTGTIGTVPLEIFPRPIHATKSEFRGGGGFAVSPGGGPGPPDPGRQDSLFSPGRSNR